MGIGFSFYCGSYSVAFDSDRGISWNLHGNYTISPERRPRHNGLVASEETVMNYLTESGVNVNDIASVKIMEPTFSKNELAGNCDVLLKGFAEAMVEEPKNAKAFSKALIKYCGVDIDH